MHKILGAGRSGMLPTLMSECARLERISSLIRGHLPEPLNQHCRVASCSTDGVLQLQTDAPAWSSRLRLQIPRLLRHLRSHAELRQLREIRLKTVPVSGGPLPDTPARRPRALSDTAAAHLRDAAAGIDAPELREALLRLANRAPGTSESG